MITITIRELMILVSIWFLWMATVAAILDWLGKRTIYRMEKKQEQEKAEGINTESDEENMDGGISLVDGSTNEMNDGSETDKFPLQ